MHLYHPRKFYMNVEKSRVLHILPQMLPSLHRWNWAKPQKSIWWAFAKHTQEHSSISCGPTFQLWATVSQMSRCVVCVCVVAHPAKTTGNEADFSARNSAAAWTKHKLQLHLIKQCARPSNVVTNLLRILTVFLTLKKGHIPETSVFSWIFLTLSDIYIYIQYRFNHAIVVNQVSRISNDFLSTNNATRSTSHGTEVHCQTSSQGLSAFCIFSRDNLGQCSGRRTTWLNIIHVAALPFPLDTTTSLFRS